MDGRKGIQPVKTEWWGAGVVVCLERGADLHMTQLMRLPLTVSCFSKIHIGFTFLVPAHPGCPGQRACVCVCVLFLCFTAVCSAGIAYLQMQKQTTSQSDNWRCLQRVCEHVVQFAEGRLVAAAVAVVGCTEHRHHVPLVAPVETLQKQQQSEHFIQSQALALLG